MTPSSSGYGESDSVTSEIWLFYTSVEKMRKAKPASTQLHAFYRPKFFAELGILDTGHSRRYIRADIIQRGQLRKESSANSNNETSGLRDIIS
jgi:hypothetical protein